MKQTALFICTLFAANFLLGAAPVKAQPANVPEAGIKAEMGKDWGRAVAVYKDALAKQPARYDLWLRIADIEAARKDLPAAANAVEKAALQAPETMKAALYQRLSQTWAVANQPDKALSAINKALEYKLGHVELIESQAKLAMWQGDYDLAIESYKTLLEKSPQTYESLTLPMAKAMSWQGRLDEAVEYFPRYLEKHRDDQEAWLAYGYAQSWRGDFNAAMDAVETYGALAGDNGSYREAKARFLARAGKTERALALTGAKQISAVDQAQAIFTRTLALGQARRYREALSGLEDLSACCRDLQAREDLEKQIMTPLRDSITLDSFYASDSDSIDIAALTLASRKTVTSDLFLIAGAEKGAIEAERSSGLQAVNNQSRMYYEAFTLGAEYRLQQDLWLKAQGGFRDTDQTEAAGIYAAEIDYRANDDLKLGLSVDRDFHAVSPRAMSLDITRTATQGRLTWTPDLLHTVVMEGGYEFYSDHNERWHVTLAPRRQIMRTEDFNLDLGLYGRAFGFSRELGNGYYDPATYRQVLVTALGYYKIDDNNGVSISIAPGIHRDENLSHYKFSGNAAIEGTFGIYDDWMLKIRAGIVNNIGVNDTTYQRGQVGLSVTRRF